MCASHACRPKNPVNGDVVLLLQIAHHSVCAFFAQPLIECRWASLIRKTRYFDYVALLVLCLLSDFVKLLFILCAQGRAIDAEVYGGLIFRYVVIQVRNALVRLGYTLIGLLGGSLCLSSLLLHLAYLLFCLFFLILQLALRFASSSVRCASVLVRFS